MSEKYSIEKDLKEAESMAKSLVPYVHQENLYGSAGGGGFFGSSQMPSLTIGALLMRFRRLNALRDELSSEQVRRLDAAIQRHDDIYKEWKVHYEQKMVREATSRLKAMSTFFEECAQNPALCARVYGPEASRRTIVQEILIALEEMDIEDEDLQKLVRATDGKLRRYVEMGDFFWSDALEAVYPKSTFWWLYGQPPVPVQ